LASEYQDRPADDQPDRSDHDAPGADGERDRAESSPDAAGPPGPVRPSGSAQSPGLAQSPGKAQSPGLAQPSDPALYGQQPPYTSPGQPGLSEPARGWDPVDRDRLPADNDLPEYGRLGSEYGPDAYGPPGYGASDGYGLTEAYLPPDPYLSGQSYFPPDPYGPPPGPVEPPEPPGPAAPRGSRAAAPAHAPGARPAQPGAGGRPAPGDPHAPPPLPAAAGVAGSRGAAGGRTAGPAHPVVPVESIESLTPEYLLPSRRRAPSPGWRRILYQVSAGLVRVPESAAELRRRDMISRIRTPVAGGHHRVAVLSLKGGVGKTTTTVGLGATLASLRGDRVIAVDANPDRGTLSDKVRLETAATVRDLLNERGQIERYADVRAFTSQAPSRLEVLGSDRDPTVSVAFSEDDYAEVSRVLEHYYSICLTDCGTGLLHSAMTGVLRLTDQIVLISSPSVDGARSASATLDWLAAHEYSDLVQGAVVVLSIVRPGSRSTVDLDRLEQHFAARCRAVTRIPYDAHLEEGAEVELDQLSRATAEAYLALAAIVGDGLAWPKKAGPRAP
jgi:MinD-like ATPase involved in chromosome partitioning or flagellar assembly